MSSKFVKISAFTFLLGVMAACTMPYSTFSYTSDRNAQNRICPIPTKAHSNPVDVYYLGEEITEPYVKIKSIASVVESSYAGPVLRRLKKRAQLIGVDALIVMHTSTFTETSSDYCEVDDVVETTSTTYTRVTTVGIKYVKNINGLENQLSKITIDKYDTVAEKFVNDVEVVHFNPNGTFLQVPKKTGPYEASIRPFSFEYLLKERNRNWRWRRKELYVDGKLISFVAARYKYYYVSGGRYRDITVNLSYDSNYEQITGLEVNGSKNFRMSWEKDDKGKVERKTISFESGAQYEQQFWYDEQGKILTLVMNRIDKTGVKTPLYRLAYDYYSIDDLDEVVARCK